MDIPYYDTKVSVYTSINDIERLLNDFDVIEVRKRKTADRKEVESITFIVQTEIGIFPIEVSPNWRQLFNYKKEHRNQDYYGDQEEGAIRKAKRCVWRVEFWAIKSALAKIKAQTSTLHRIFLPDIIIDNKGTKMADMLENNQMLLTAPDSETKEVSE